MNSAPPANDPRRSRPARRSRGRRLLYSCVLLVALWLLVEAIAFVGYFAVYGERFSFARVHAAQAARARTAAEPSVPTNIAYQSNRVTCIHPYLGFVADPGTDDQMLATSRGYGMSRFGFIDDQSPVRKRDPRKVLVGILGGSVAQFFSDEGADALAMRLRQHPAYAGKRIEFVRLALVGFKQPQQLFALAYLLALGGELDLVINLDGVNEATLAPENVARGVPAFFPRNWSLIAEGAPDPVQRRLVGTVTLLQDVQRRVAVSFGHAPWRWSVAAGLLWQRLDGWLDRAAGARLRLLQQQRRDDLPFHVRGPGVTVAADTVDQGDAQADDNTATWVRCSRAMHRICEAHGIRYFHFLQPNQYLSGSKQFSDDELRRAFIADAWQRPWVERTYPRMRAAGAQLAADGLRFSDLTQLFVDVSDTIYVDDCCHVNAAGNLRMAQAIAAAILRDAGTGGGAARPAPTALRVEPSQTRMTRPFERIELRVWGARADGGEDDVTYADPTFTSSDPLVVAVDAYGTLTALGDGEARIEVRSGALSCATTVTVRFPMIVDLGGAFAPAPLRRPLLRASADGAKLSVTPPGDGLPGAVTFALTAAPRALCGGVVYVPLQSSLIEALSTSGGELQVDFASPDPQRKTVYVQVVYRVSSERCGYAVSNALAITR